MENRFLTLERTIATKKGTGQKLPLGRAYGSTVEITAELLQAELGSANAIKTPADVIALITKIHTKYPNAKISGDVLREVFGSQAPAEAVKVLKVIHEVEKAGTSLKVSLTVPEVEVTAGDQTVTIKHPVEAILDKIDTSETVIRMKGISVWAGKINKIFITAKAVQVKVGILPAITVWEVETSSAKALHYSPGSSAALALNLGEQIVKNYNESANKTPGGDCFAVAKSRLKEAYQQVHGKDLYSDLPASPVAGLSSRKFFDMLWNIWYWHNSWLKAPVQHRAKGSAGASAWAGFGSAVDHAGVTSGLLKPGALVQTWRTRAQFEHLRDHHNSLPEGAFGHSFIFLKYHYENGNITGMYIADQGTGWDGASPMKLTTWGHYAGANLT